MENLFFEATEKEDKKIIQQLFETISEQNNISSDEIVSGLDFLLEAWGESIESSSVKAGFCLDVALLNPPDSQVLRISLHRAFNCLKTSPFMKSTIVKAAGIRNHSLSIKAIAERFNVIEKLQPGIRIFNSLTNRLGCVEQIDEITSEITVKWDTANSPTVMDLETSLEGIFCLEKSPELPLDGDRKLSGSVDKWTAELKKSFLSLCDEQIFKQFTFALAIDKGITPEEFELWWNGSSDDDDSNERHPSTARSLLELNTLLIEYKEGKFSAEQQDALNNSLSALKLRSEPSEMLMLAESIAMLADFIPEENLVSIVDQIKDQAVFWPSVPKDSKDKLNAWEKLSAKHLPALARITADIFSQEYLAQILMNLSYRCWNSIVSVLDEKVLANTIENTVFLSSDALLWIWKNRAKLKSETVAVISPDALRKALDSHILTSKNELKQLFIADKSFQKELLKRIDGNEMDLLRAVQACESIRMDEKQSLLVKFSALSSVVRQFIEKGDGKKMFAAAGRKHVEKQSADAFDVTSIHSFEDMTQQLNDIINKQIPENSAAIAHARSYGDLRENAEYKAAKERQAFLQKRRAEIDSSLQKTKPIDFSLIKPDKTAVPGSTVTLQYKDNGSETFYLLGVWDSDPETQCIAYTSALGKAINEKHLNDQVKLPDGREAVIVKIELLPKEMLAKLNVD